MPIQGPADVDIWEHAFGAAGPPKLQEKPRMRLFNKAFQFRNFDKSFNFLKGPMHTKQNIAVWTVRLLTSGLQHHQLSK